MRRLWRVVAWMLCLASLVVFLSCRSDKPMPPEAMDARPLCVALGGEIPTAADFLTDEARSRCKKQGIEVSFSAAPDFFTLGERQTKLLLTDQRGSTAELITTYTVLSDVTPPVLSGVRPLSFVVGDGAVLRQGVSVADDCFGKVTLSVDASELDMNREGSYPVTYRAADAMGNATQQTATVTIYGAPFDEVAFKGACDEILSLILPADPSREQICRAVYEYVQKTLFYVPVSDHSDAGRAALTALERGRGDCFSYFALARALFERAGVPCLAIERIHEVGEETHFWLMVDLDETGKAPRWYHFDPTELNVAYGEHNGCLFTDAQLDVYNAARPGFYAYDRAAYPASETKILSATGEQGGR